MDINEPEEGDYTSADHIQWFQYGKAVLWVNPNEDYKEQLRNHMNRNNFWPNAWLISDHGNAHKINLKNEGPPIDERFPFLHH